MVVSTFDPASRDLALHFLQDDDVSDLTPEQQEARIVSLAQAIQQAVEDWCEAEAEQPAGVCDDRR